MHRELFNRISTKIKRRKLRREMTAAEKKLWNELRNSQIEKCKFRRQVGIGHFIVDFYCPSKKLVIEVDGETHFSKAEITYDESRTNYLVKNGIEVIRFTNIDIFESIEGVIEEIKKYLISR